MATLTDNTDAIWPACPHCGERDGIHSMRVHRAGEKYLVTEATLACEHHVEQPGFALAPPMVWVLQREDGGEYIQVDGANPTLTESLAGAYLYAMRRLLPYIKRLRGHRGH